MKSKTVPSFWKAYETLAKNVKEEAKNHTRYGEGTHFIHHCILSVLTKKKMYGH
ncbi:MAG: hypothetical protein AB1393_11245 [Candidatus Edwardsbacteria bacterium]